MTCLLCGWSKLAWFQCGDGTWLDLSVGIKLIWLLCRWSKWTWRQWKDRNWLGYGVAVENYLFLVWESKSTRLVCQDIEIDSILEWGSKLTWFQWWNLTYFVFRTRDRRWLGFIVGIEIDLFSRPGSKLTSFPCAGRELLGLNIFIKIDLVLVCGARITCFQCEHRNWRGFVWVVEIDLISV